MKIRIPPVTINTKNIKVTHLCFIYCFLIFTYVLTSVSVYKNNKNALLILKITILIKN